ANPAVAVFDLSLRPDSRTESVRVDGILPTLTATDEHLWLMGVCDNMPKYNRFLRPEERCALMGLDPSVLERVDPDCRLAAVGDAMALPTVGLVMASLWSGTKEDLEGTQPEQAMVCID
ncbi:unnamed protein product, partial [Prorocentrum cordatum]